MDGISVVIPCYNRGEYLRACIASVLQQDYEGPLEILVGDDGSTDDSARVAESFGAQVRLLRHPQSGNHGVSTARNLCLRAASQPLIAFLDADDLWLPGHLSALAGALAAKPASAMAYDNGCYLSAEGREYGTRLAAGHTPPRPETLLLDCCLAVNGVVARKAVFEQVGLFDESLRYCEDHDMWLRIIENFPVVYVPVNGWVYRQHAQQLTKSAEMWRYARQVVTKARARYPYDKSAIRKRTAVISYRQGQSAFRDRSFARAVYFLGKAALCDPRRAVRELALRLRGQGTT